MGITGMAGTQEGNTCRLCNVWYIATAAQQTHEWEQDTGNRDGKQLEKHCWWCVLEASGEVHRIVHKVPCRPAAGLEWILSRISMIFSKVFSMLIFHIILRTELPNLRLLPNVVMRCFVTHPRSRM